MSVVAVLLGRGPPGSVSVIEGTRSFGIELARAVAAACLTVIECEQPQPQGPRILLGTRHELTVVITAQTNRLGALLLGGGDTERDLARATLTDSVLLAMVRRREPPQASREQAVRHSEIRRLAHAIRAGRHALAANRAQLQAIIDQIAPGLTERRGIGAVTAAQAIVSFSHPGRCRGSVGGRGHLPPLRSVPRRRRGPRRAGDARAPVAS